MAALTRHAFPALTKSSPIISNSWIIPARTIKSRKPAQKPKKKATLESVMSSIEARGFLRPYKPYQPDSDVSDRVENVCISEGLNASDDTRIDDMLLRFKVFAKCADEFNHCIPNSRLVTIETIGDLKTFYQTAVITTTPYDALQNIEIPPNLHVEKDYHRFHPDTDKLFKGKTAFPQNATLVTGLKYKDKYPGHRPEKPWPIRVHNIFKN